MTAAQKILAGIAVLAGLTALTVALAALVLHPPASDLLRLLVFLPFSGGLSVLLGVFLTSFRREGLLRGVRGKLLTAVALSSLLVLINVAFTAYLMFLSPHDLELLTLLLLFSFGISLFFALLVSDSFHATLRQLLAGVTEMGQGRLNTRISVRSGDEVEDLATAFNSMATQLQDSIARREELEEARRQLIGAVSHDLRTPLATMRAMVESLNDGVVTDAETTERYHRTMQGEIAYLSRLIDDLFELSQIDSGMLQLRAETGNIGDLISDTLEALRPQADERRLYLHGQLADSLPSVVMDVPRMQRVLYNLVQNALRHTPADGTVVIKAVETAGDVEISVADTGEGVDFDELPHIFDRFYRGNRARTRDRAGSGLGLTIAKGIVELHGGQIWAQSDRGQGATFTFTLPKSGPVLQQPTSGQLTR